MSGVDTVRGIGYQQAQALLAAIDVLDDRRMEALRIEGVDDIVDVEVFLEDGSVIHAKQIKTRREPYTWSRADLAGILERWARLPAAEHASFEFLTDGRLGPTGEEVSEALVAASTGNLDPLAQLFGEDISPELLIPLGKATIRIDPGGVGALLLRAERQVASILPSIRGMDDAREQAKRAVSDLFVLLFERGGTPDPRARMIGRAEIAATLGVAVNQAADARWPGSLRDRYIQHLFSADLGAVVAPTLEPYSRFGSAASRLEPLILLDSTPALVVGRTGSGKSTLAAWICQNAALSGRIALVAHAEAYLPNRLAALAADAMADQLGEDFPSATGRQLVADPELTLLIDGVSEIPPPNREALRVELSYLVAANRGARIVLLGRDIATLREVLPSTVVPTTFLVSPLDDDRQLEIARRIVLGVSSTDTLNHSDREDVRRIVAQVGVALGNGAGNPLLFTWALSLLSEGIPFTSRAGMYAAFIERMAERTGVSGILEATLSFGVVSARLLDLGRRYADPYEWQQLLSDASDELRLRRSGLDEQLLNDKIRRSGLVSPLGYTQIVVPFHDSFADYSAGLVHARGLLPLPSRLQTGDAQRVLFASEIGGVDSTLSAAVTRDLPYESVRLAAFEKRMLSTDSPLEIEALLKNLLPDGEATAVFLSQTDDGRDIAVLVRDEGESRWLDQSTAFLLLKTRPGVVVARGGPLAVAVQLWRQHVQAHTSPKGGLGSPRLRSLDSAIETLDTHARDAAQVTRKMAEAVAPPGRLKELLMAIGPLGLQAVVYPEKGGTLGRQWPLKYRHIDGVDVRQADETGEVESSKGSERWGAGSVESFTDKHPSQEASKRVRDAFGSLTSMKWL